MHRHLAAIFAAHICQSTVYAHVGSIALRSRGDIGHGLGQGNPGFWHAQELHSLGSGIGQHQGHRVGIAHIFSGTDNHPAGDELHILPCRQHAG